jgi:hypothetical protein
MMRGTGRNGERTGRAVGVLCTRDWRPATSDRVCRYKYLTGPGAAAQPQRTNRLSTLPRAGEGRGGSGARGLLGNRELQCVCESDISDRAWRWPRAADPGPNGKTADALSVGLILVSLFLLLANRAVSWICPSGRARSFAGDDSSAAEREPMADADFPRLCVA